MKHPVPRDYDADLRPCVARASPPQHWLPGENSQPSDRNWDVLGLRMDHRPASNDVGDNLRQIHKRMAEASLTTQWLLRASSAFGSDFRRSRPSDGLGTASSDGGNNLWQQGLAERRAGDEEDTERREKGGEGNGREGKGARPEQNSATASGR
jgi:hypothetical protein